MVKPQRLWYILFSCSKDGCAWPWPLSVEIFGEQGEVGGSEATPEMFPGSSLPCPLAKHLPTPHWLPTSSILFFQRSRCTSTSCSSSLSIENGTSSHSAKTVTTCDDRSLSTCRSTSRTYVARLTCPNLWQGMAGRP